MKKLILLLLFPFLLQSQNFPELDISPMDKSHFSRQKEVATITYSRPQLKGRALKDIIKLNNIWRTGANEANELLLYVDIEINNIVVSKGTYKIFTYFCWTQSKYALSNQKDVHYTKPKEFIFVLFHS